MIFMEIHDALLLKITKPELKGKFWGFEVDIRMGDKKLDITQKIMDDLGQLGKSYGHFECFVSQCGCFPFDFTDFQEALKTISL